MLRKLKVAKITDDFLKIIKKLKTKDIYKTPSFKGGKKWLTVKMTYDPDEKGKEFYFCERLGKNSLGFILYDSSKDEYQVLKQYSSPYERFINGAFTGSLEKQNKSVIEHLIEEVKEEAGYDVSEKDCHFMSSEFVGSSTNEIVYLYVVDITDKDQEIREPENIFEANMSRYNMSAEEVCKTCEWKALIIIQRHKDLINATRT